MGLNTVLVDRARPIVKARAGAKVEGSTRYADVPGQWFKCRLTLTESSDRADDAGSPRKVTDRPSLLYGVKDLDGALFALDPGVRLEVKSTELGHLFYDVAGTPEVLRKKRRVLGYQVSLRAVAIAPAPEV